MKEKTDWTTNTNKTVRVSGPDSNSATSSEPRRSTLLKDRNLVRAGFAVIAGILIAALAKGTKDSDYYD